MTSKNGLIKRVLKFLITNVIVKNLIAAIIIAIIIITGFSFFIDIYTHHGEAISVDDFTGLSIEEAEKILNEKKLKYIIIDSVYSSEYKKGAIVEQTPPPDFKVKEGRKIFLTIKAYNQEQVKMPNLIGVSYIQAKASLETYGLEIGELIYAKDIALNNVLAQKFNNKPVETGVQIPKGSLIDLVLGDGAGKKNQTPLTSIPVLTGLTGRAAKNKANEAYLNIGFRKFASTVKTKKDSVKARVYKQKPNYNYPDMKKLGSYVDIWLTNDTTLIPKIKFQKKDTENEKDSI